MKSKVLSTALRILFISVCMITIFSSANIDVHASAQTPVRVGIFDFSGFYGTDLTGKPSGYGYDYLNQIEKFSDIRFEYIHASWSDCLDMLEKGEIDMLDSAQYTPERADKFLFSKFSTGISYGKLYTRINNSTLGYNDFDAMNGIKVGFLAGNSRNQNFLDFCAKHNFATVNTEYDDVNVLKKALQSGEMDAIVSSNLRKSDDEKPIAIFSPSPFYIITKKDNIALMDKINEALEQIQLDNPTYNLELYKKYYENSDNSIILNSNEIEFIRNSKPISVVYDSFWAPFESYNAQTGTASGINADILNLIAGKTGLHFNFLSGYDYEQAISLVSNKQTDMLLSYDTNPEKAKELDILLSDTFLSTPIAIIGRTHNITASSVFAIPKIYPVHLQFVKTNFPGNTVIETESIEECYSAINNGTADYTMENIYAVTDVIKSGEYGDLVVSSVTTLIDNFSFALRSDIDPILLSILNKSIKTIPKSELDSLLLAYTTNYSADTSPQVFLKRYQNEIMVVMLIFVLVVVAVLSFIIFMQRRNKKALWNMAYIDSLTGLSNLNKFKKDSLKFISDNPGKLFAMAKLDVDRFNLINEMYGFEEGDRVLKTIAQTFCKFNDGHTLAARVGNDEFAVLFCFTSEEEADTAKDEYVKTFKSYIFSKTGYDLKFPAGRYILEPDETDIDAVYEKVNYAHRMAKKQFDSNEVFDYSLAMKMQSIRQKEIENKMQASLSGNEFKVYLQPKYRLSDDALIGAEALVRWQEGKHDLVYPNEFIPLFEQNGFITKLDMYMFEKVCRIIQGWVDKNQNPVTVSVNFSRLHLKNKHFVDELITIADRYDIPKKFLEVEITESTMLNNETDLEQILSKLHDAGFTLSMDDFGTGYSSLGLLKNLPVDVIKIDRGFFTNNKYKTRAKTVIANVIKMAKELKIQTLAEGVESKEHIDFLKEIGCESVQGYFYARPMPADDFSISKNMISPYNEEEENLDFDLSDFSYNSEPNSGSGDDIPVSVYRLFNTALRKALTVEYGEGEMVDILRKCGKLAGRAFAKANLDFSLDFESFIKNISDKLSEMRLGVLNLESLDAAKSSAVVTISNDITCAGSPDIGKTLCNYDEGFISGILYEYTKKNYSVVEIDCWGTGSKLCRFTAKVK